MDRDTLVRILTQARGVSGKEPRYEVASDHRLTLYLGRPGRAMEVSEVRALALEDDFLAVEHGEEETFYCAAADVHGVSVQPTKHRSDRRPGFA